MASLIRRNNRIFYIIESDGVRRRWRSTGTRVEGEARKLFQNCSRKIGRPRVMTLRRFKDELPDYVLQGISGGTQSLYEISLKHLIEIIGDKPLKLIRPIDVERFKSERMKSVSATRANIEFRSLRAIFNRALLLGLIESNPFNQCRQVRLPISHPAYLKKEEFCLLLNEEPDKEFKALLAFAASTMMRRGEILALEWSDLDFANRLINIQNKETFTVKNRRPRALPMSETIFNLLTSLERKSNFVFSSEDGKPLVPQTISRQFKKLVLKCGLSGKIHFHSIRHSGASWLAQEGVPLYEIQSLLGHSSPAQTEIYAHLSHEKLRETVERIKWD